MDAGKTIFATSFFSAVLVLGAAAPLGYFGLQELNKKLEAGQSEVQRVVIELKTEALKEIQAAASQAANGGMTAGGQADPVVMASLEQLQTNVAELRRDQQQLLEIIGSTPDTMMPDTMMPAAASMAPTSMEDALNQTVLFPMGKTATPAVDEQIRSMASEIAEYGQNRACQTNVTGYSDTLGGDKSNLKLSEERAIHVAALLRGRQILVGEVKGWGERWLKVHTVDGVENEQNRRVVMETACRAMPSGNVAAVS